MGQILRPDIIFIRVDGKVGVKTLGGGTVRNFKRLRFESKVLILCTVVQERVILQNAHFEGTLLVPIQLGFCISHDRILQSLIRSNAASYGPIRETIILLTQTLIPDSGPSKDVRRGLS